MPGRCFLIFCFGFIAACGAQSASPNLDDREAQTPTSSPKPTSEPTAENTDPISETENSSETDNDSPTTPLPTQANCPQGYADVNADGTLCEDIDECALGTDNCDSLAPCSNTQGSFRCGACPQGYLDIHGDGTACNDVDECTLGVDNCDSLVSCSNTQGSFRCGSCPQGYFDLHSDGTTCNDVDECALRIDNCDSIVPCNNTLGSFRCGACPQDHIDVHQDGTLCASINDECALGTHNCDTATQCIDTEEGFSCTACPQGYIDVHQDGTQCDDVNECDSETHPCDALSVCRNISGSFRCHPCSKGYVVDSNDHTQCRDIDECASETDDCDALVACNNTEGGFYCDACPPEYEDVQGDGTSCLLEFNIGGSVVGLTAAGLILENQANEVLSIAQNGSFVFPTPQIDESHYAVHIIGQPSGQFCSIAMDEGSLSGNDAMDIAVTCQKFVVDARPSASSMTLMWPDVGAERYDIVYTTDEMCDINDIEACANSERVEHATSPYLVQNLDNGVFYYATIIASPNTQTEALTQVAALPNPWVSDGHIRSVAFAPDGTKYIGGYFRQFGPKTGSGVPLSIESGFARKRFPQIDGIVHAVVSDGSGGWYVGGGFSIKNDTTGTSNLIHILENGDIEPIISYIMEATVTSLELSENILYAGGYFKNLRWPDGSRKHLIAIDTTNNEITPWGPKIQLPYIRAIKVFQDTVYIGGDSIQRKNQQKTPALLALDKTTGLPTSRQITIESDESRPIRTSVHSMVISDNKLYFGGFFIKVEGVSRNYAAALDLDTFLITPWNPDPNYTVYALTVSDNIIYMGGSFSSIGGQLRSNIAAIQKTTGIATDWNPDIGYDSVRAISVHQGVVYAGGLFRHIKEQQGNNITAIDTQTALPTGWDPGATGPVHALALAGDTIYVGGHTDNIGGGRRQDHLAAIDPTTSMLTHWAPHLDSGIRSMLVHEETLYIGGFFRTIDQTSRHMIAAFDLSTGHLKSWSPKIDGRPSFPSVSALAAFNSTLYVGGSFHEVGSQDIQYLTAIDTITGLPKTEWRPNPNNHVLALALRGDTLYAAGEFTEIGEENRDHIAALNAHTGLPTNWAPHSDQTVETLEVTDHVLYAGGDFRTIGQAKRNSIAAIDLTTGLATDWDPQLEDNHAKIYALKINGDTLYAGGRFKYPFTDVRPYQQPGFIALDATTAQPKTWNHSIIDAHILDFAIHGNKLYVGGFIRERANTQRRENSLMEAFDLDQLGH